MLGDVRSHVMSRHLPWQLNGGCIETAVDSNLVGLHLPRTAMPQRRQSARYKEWV